MFLLILRATMLIKKKKSLRCCKKQKNFPLLLILANNPLNCFSTSLIKKFAPLHQINDVQSSKHESMVGILEFRIRIQKVNLFQIVGTEIIANE